MTTKCEYDMKATKTMFEVIASSYIDQGDFIVHSPDLNIVVSGSTSDEASINFRKAIMCLFESVKKRGTIEEYLKSKKIKIRKVSGQVLPSEAVNFSIQRKITNKYHYLMTA